MTSDTTQFIDGLDLISLNHVLVCYLLSLHVIKSNCAISNQLRRHHTCHYAYVPYTVCVNVSDRTELPKGSKHYWRYSNLVPGQEYFVNISASTAVGEGPRTEAVVFTAYEAGKDHFQIAPNGLRLAAIECRIDTTVYFCTLMFLLMAMVEIDNRD